MIVSNLTHVIIVVHHILQFMNTLYHENKLLPTRRRFHYTSIFYVVFSTISQKRDVEFVDHVILF